MSELEYRLIGYFGTLVLELLRDEPRYYGEKGYMFKILASMVMPDHIHVAIQVLKPLPKSIGIVVRGFKSACTSLYKRTYATNGCKYATKGENVEKSDIPTRNDSSAASDFHFSRIFTRSGSIWQPNAAYYHERIIHGYSQIDSLIRYIKSNPRRLAQAEMFDRPETEAAVYAKTGIHDLPHTAQRYRFLALNAMATELCRLTER